MNTAFRPTAQCSSRSRFARPPLSDCLVHPPRVVTEPVSVLDLVPAVVDFLELPPHGNFQGRDHILAPDYSAKGRPLLFTIPGHHAGGRSPAR